MDSWESSEKWYTECVGEKGHYYHQAIVLPSSLKLLGLKGSGSLLDLGCGQGVLARHLPEAIDYVGIDLSDGLIQSAKKLTKKKNAQFFTANACEALPVEKTDFDWGCLILCLQNMEKGEGAIENGRKHLKKGGKFLIVLNHPCFRIPRQSHWEIDEKAKLQYRRMNLYMSEMKIPIQMNPGQGEKSAVTYSYHHPISAYTNWLGQKKFKILAIEEWISDKKSEGAKAKMEDRSRREFPLFLAILAERC